MHKSKCPVCHSSHTKKNGSHKGTQTYKCIDCGYRFRNGKLPPESTLWRLYLDNKQTVAELSSIFSVSESTIKRRLQCVKLEWHQPALHGSGYVHLDATYWGHNWGVMLGLDDASGHPLYLAFIKSETNADYLAAINSIASRGYTIDGLIFDGRPSLFPLFSGYRIQMCQFHMKAIIRRYLTKKPRLQASRELKTLVEGLTTASKDNFMIDFTRWKEKWHDAIFRRTVLKSGKTQYTHRRLHQAARSLNSYIPYLFTFQECPGMPNTNNKIEGTFTDLKRNLNNHSGMTLKNRKRFIIGFFLALRQTRSMKKQDTHRR